MKKTDIQSAMHAAGFTKGQRDNPATRDRCARLIEQTKAAAFGRDDLMAVAAFRYSLGRMTYIVSDCAHWLCEQWPNIAENAQKVIQRDLEEAFKCDEDSRTIGHEYHPLGHDCDRAQWEKVRRLWQC